MKHGLILAALVAALGWLVFKPSALDRLSAHPTAAALAKMTAPAGNIFATISRSSMPVTPHYFTVPHRTTLVIFHDDTCPACRDLDRNLEDFARLRPDVAIRKVHISLNGNAYYQAIRDYRWNIYLMPCILIYDADGKLVAADEKLNDDGDVLLHRWMLREAEHAASQTSR